MKLQHGKIYFLNQDELEILQTLEEHYDYFVNISNLPNKEIYLFKYNKYNNMFYQQFSKPENISKQDRTYLELSNFDKIILLDIELEKIEKRKQEIHKEKELLSKEV